MRVPLLPRPNDDICNKIKGIYVTTQDRPIVGRTNDPTQKHLVNIE